MYYIIISPRKLSWSLPLDLLNWYYQGVSLVGVLAFVCVLALFMLVWFVCLIACVLYRWRIRKSAACLRYWSVKKETVNHWGIKLPFSYFTFGPNDSDVGSRNLGSRLGFAAGKGEHLVEILVGQRGSRYWGRGCTLPSSSIPTNCPVLTCPPLLL